MDNKFVLLNYKVVQRYDANFNYFSVLFNKTIVYT